MPTVKMIVGQSPEHAYLGGWGMIKTSERNRCAPVRFCGRKNCGFAGIDSILPTDEDEWLCAPGTKGPAVPSARGALQAHAPTYAQVRTWVSGRCCLLWASEGADVPYKGGNYSPEACLSIFS